MINEVEVSILGNGIKMNISKLKIDNGDFITCPVCNINLTGAKSIDLELHMLNHNIEELIKHLPPKMLSRMKD